MTDVQARRRNDGPRLAGEPDFDVIQINQREETPANTSCGYQCSLTWAPLTPTKSCQHQKH